MQIDQGAVAIIAVFLATQTGALIYFAGAVSATLRSHEKRIDKLESGAEKRAAAVAKLAAKEGVEV